MNSHLKSVPSNDLIKLQQIPINSVNRQYDDDYGFYPPAENFRNSPNCVCDHHSYFILQPTLTAIDTLLLTRFT